MKIEVITTYYREEFLIPLFMLHYECWVDKITLITSKFPGDRLDDDYKTRLINEAVYKSDAEWVIAPDMDEFVFPIPLGSDPREALQNESSNVIMCEMSRVWRHESDADIDRLKPPVFQRTHGTTDHHKPCIFRPRGVTLGIGQHTIECPAESKWGKPWGAVHWANADPCFGITRTKRDRQGRLAEKNIANGWGDLRHWLEPNVLENLYASHTKDPAIISL